MLRKSRRVFGWLAARAPWVIGGLFAISLAVPLMRPQPAAADGEITKLKTVAMIDLAINERLLAVDALKVEGSSSALDALKDIAQTGDLRVSAAACAALGRTGSSASKAASYGELEGVSGASDRTKVARPEVHRCSRAVELATNLDSTGSPSVCAVLALARARGWTGNSMETSPIAAEGGNCLRGRRPR